MKKNFDEILAENYSRGKFKFRCRDYVLELGVPPKIMGVLNVTPDSFSDGGQYLDEKKAVARALRMAQEGADIIDIGAESTRPGALPVSAKEQLRRIENIVRALAGKLKIPISIDTSDAAVAEQCLELGASIINDVFALRKDRKIGKIIARYKAGVVLMHMRDNPRQMQKNPLYRDVIKEIKDFLSAAKKRAQSFGIAPESIVLDPGIGFGKTVEHNLMINKALGRFQSLGAPLLLGTSRKSFIGKVLDLPENERVLGTAASVVIASVCGAKILRVHDVKQMRQAILLTDAILRQKV